MSSINAVTGCNVQYQQVTGRSVQCLTVIGNTADFPSLILPVLPSDRSRLNVHAMLSPLFIAGLLRRLQE